MKRCFVFHHGFMMDKNYWQNLLPYFEGEEYILLDAGYYGKPSNFQPEEDVEYIGIGHSLGVIKLLQTGADFKYLIGLNSFLHFAHDMEKQLVSHNLMQLYNNFQKDGSASIKLFWRTSGVKYLLKSLHKLRLKKILNDFNLLKQDFRSKILPHSLFISSQDDPVVTLKMTEYNFQERKDIELILLKTGLHALGYLNPELIYKHIINFIEKNDAKNRVRDNFSSACSAYHSITTVQKKCATSLIVRVKNTFG